MYLKDSGTVISGNQDVPFNSESSVILGTGKIDILGILEASKNTAIEYIFIEDECPQALEQISQSVKYLRSLGY